MYDQPVDNKRNKSVVVAKSILSSIQALRKEGTKPTFNAVLAYLGSRRILSNHRSLRAYLDIMVKSGLLSLRKERVKQRGRVKETDLRLSGWRISRKKISDWPHPPQT